MACARLVERAHDVALGQRHEVAPVDDLAHLALQRRAARRRLAARAVKVEKLRAEPSPEAGLVGAVGIGGEVAQRVDAAQA